MELLIIGSTLVFCMIVGKIIENGTIKKLETEEQRLKHILIFNEKGRLLHWQP